MALTKIPGSLVGVWISFDLVTPAWKEISCDAETTTLTGSSTTNTKKTKRCGTLQAVSFDGWNMSGSGVANATPTVTEVSIDDLVTTVQDTTPVLVKLAHTTDETLVYRSAEGTFSSYDENYPEGEDATFNYTIAINGNVNIVAPA